MNQLPLSVHLDMIQSESFAAHFGANLTYTFLLLPSRLLSYSVFRLTDPPGLSTISKCKDSRTFHPHPENLAIYTDACDRGHVRFTKAKVQTVDLR